MDGFTKGLEQLTAAKERRELVDGVDVVRLFSRDELAGAAYAPGDRVVDLVTKKGGHVAAVGYARDSRPSTGR
jgi:hypothetical protein